MIESISPINTPAYVAGDIDQYIVKHAITPSGIADILKEKDYRNIGWVMFSECGISAKVEDGIFQIKSISKVGFDQLYDAYLRSTYGFGLASLIDEDRINGGITKPLSLALIDVAIKNIIFDCNEKWKMASSMTAEGVGSVVCNVLSRYDNEIVPALNRRLSSEAVEREPTHPWFNKLFSNFKK